MIRCRTLYSSYPQDLWKRSPILRKLAIRVRHTLGCSKNDQIHHGERLRLKTYHPTKSVPRVHRRGSNCALMNKRSRELSYCWF
jgi:hypothetical protein